MYYYYNPKVLKFYQNGGAALNTAPRPGGGVH